MFEYGPRSRNYLQMLDAVHKQGFTLCLASFRTSPVESLYVDEHESYLGTRHAKLTLKFAAKMKSLPKQLHMSRCLIINIRSCLIRSQISLKYLVLESSSSLLLLTLIYVSSWRHLHIFH